MAITVRPPPVTAPATTAYFSGSVNPGTRVARYVNFAGVWLVNENVTPPTVTAPNPHLKPETADNCGGRSQMQ